MPENTSLNKSGRDPILTPSRRTARMASDYFWGTALVAPGVAEAGGSVRVDPPSGTAGKMLVAVRATFVLNSG